MPDDQPGPVFRGSLPTVRRHRGVGRGPVGEARLVLAVLLLALLVAGCASGTGYADLTVGDCVSGEPGIEGSFAVVECGHEDLDRSAYEVVGKAPEGDGAYRCPGLSSGIVDDGYVVCFTLRR